MKRLPLLIMLFVGVMANAAERDTVVPRTYEYVQRDGKPLLMDVYLPSTPRADSACVVYLFGGGFVNGSRDMEIVRLYCQSLVRNGFAAIAIDYRLHLREVDNDTIRLTNMQHIFRDAINIATSDCAAAIAYICRNAAAWGIAANRIVLCGGSAGAIGVLQLDYCRANGFAPAAELPDGWKPAAVVAYSGAIYADGVRPQYKTAPSPTFFLHGDKDRIVNYKKFPPVLRSGLYGPKKLHRVFEKNAYSHWFYTYEGIGHEVANLHIYTLPEALSFVEAVLRGRQMRYDATVHDSKIVPTKWTDMNVFDLYKGN